MRSFCRANRTGHQVVINGCGPPTRELPAPEDTRDVIRSTSETSPPGEHQDTVRAEDRVGVRNLVYGIRRKHTGRLLIAIIGTQSCAFWGAPSEEPIADQPIRTCDQTRQLPRLRHQDPALEADTPDDEGAPMS